MIKGIDVKFKVVVVDDMLSLTAPPECWVNKMRDT